MDDGHEKPETHRGGVAPIERRRARAIVLDDAGRPVRPTIEVRIDPRTREVIGFDLSFPSADGQGPIGDGLGWEAAPAS